MQQFFQEALSRFGLLIAIAVFGSPGWLILAAVIMHSKSLSPSGAIQRRQFLMSCFLNLCACVAVFWLFREKIVRDIIGILVVLFAQAVIINAYAVVIFKAHTWKQRLVTLLVAILMTLGIWTLMAWAAALACNPRCS